MQGNLYQFYCACSMQIESFHIDHYRKDIHICLPHVSYHFPIGRCMKYHLYVIVPWPFLSSFFHLPLYLLLFIHVNVPFLSRFPFSYFLYWSFVHHFHTFFPFHHQVQPLFNLLGRYLIYHKMSYYQTLAYLQLWWKCQG